MPRPSSSCGGVWGQNVDGSCSGSWLLATGASKCVGLGRGRLKIVRLPEVSGGGDNLDYITRHLH